MTSKHFRLLYLLISLTLCYVYCEFESKSRKSTRRLTKLLKLNETEEIRVNRINCSNLPPTVLTDVLGAAFNSRYMSIEQPKYLEEHLDNSYSNSYTTKRNSELIQPFYVDDTFALEISDKPAWEVKHTSEEHDENLISIDHYSYDNDTEEIELNRLKRDVHRGRNKRPWECEAKIKWIDLGPDYFPRFLRSVECTKKKCWYNYLCKHRSFTVKLLRRRNGECVQTNQLHRVTNSDLPGEFKELWVWEERAVNFCCDCVPS